MTPTRCPCLSGEAYNDCCGPLHEGRAAAVTAGQLMRSRFSAYAVGNAGYLLATWHRSTRPADLSLDPELRWYRLDVVDTVDGGPFAQVGTVEFCAWYRHPSGNGSMHEVSSFVRVGTEWFYVREVG